MLMAIALLVVGVFPREDPNQVGQPLMFLVTFCDPRQPSEANATCCAQSTHYDSHNVAPLANVTSVTSLQQLSRGLPASHTLLAPPSGRHTEQILRNFTACRNKPASLTSVLPFVVLPRNEHRTHAHSCSPRRGQCWHIPTTLSAASASNLSLSHQIRAST